MIRVSSGVLAGVGGLIAQPAAARAVTPRFSADVTGKPDLGGPAVTSTTDDRGIT